MQFLLQLAFAAVAAAVYVPATLEKRTVSPDGTCGIQYDGAGKGYTCPTGWTKCCSQYGWCGDSADHCGTGCQSAYGSCNGGGGTPTTTTPVPTPTGGGTPGSVPYGTWIYGCTVTGKFALSFDDGPYDYTASLLNMLQSRGVKATFFVNGQNWGAPITDPSSGKAAIIQRIVNEGHQLGSHTWSHPDLNTLSASAIQTEMTTLNNALYNIIGKRPTYMRPPYFNCNANCLSALSGYHIINTNLDTNDWQLNTANSIAAVQNAIAGTNPPYTPGWLPLLHDVHANTVNNVVGPIIDAFVNKGYTSATVGECLGDPAANWYV